MTRKGSGVRFPHGPQKCWSLAWRNRPRVRTRPHAVGVVDGTPKSHVELRDQVRGWNLFGERCPLPAPQRHELCVVASCGRLSQFGGQRVRHWISRHINWAQLLHEAVSHSSGQAAGDVRREHDVGRSGARQRSAMRRGGARFRAEHERGTELGGARAEAKDCRDSSSIHDPASGDHGHIDCVTDQRHQCESADERVVWICLPGAVMTPGLSSLGADHVNAGLLQGQRLLDIGRGTYRDDLSRSEP